jgi:hypothetical protein
MTSIVSAQSLTPPQSLPLEYYRKLGLIPQSSKIPSGTLSLQAVTSNTTFTYQASGSVQYTVDLSNFGQVANQSVIIENIGDTTINNPWLVANNQRDWFDVQSMLDEMLQGETDPAKRAFRIWRYLRDNRYHWYPAEDGNEIHDPVKFLNVYGYGFCDDSANNSEALFKLAGFQDAHCWELSGHVVCEVFYENGWHMLDPDVEVFYPKRDNIHVASVEDCEADGWLVGRVSGSTIEDIYTTTDNNWMYDDLWVLGHTMAVSLRPGESLERCWYNWGKYHDNLYLEEPPVYGNGRMTYTPRLDLPNPLAGFDVVSNLTCQNNGTSSPTLQLTNPGQPGTIVLSMKCPYVAVGGQLQINARMAQATDQLTAEFSHDGVTWQSMAQWSGPLAGLLNCPLDPQIQTNVLAACYGFSIRLTVDSNSTGSVQLNQIQLTDEFECAPAALPVLLPGQINNMNFQMDPTSGSLVRISHVYQLAPSLPEQAALLPVWPAIGSSVSTTDPTLTWNINNPAELGTQCHLLISWDPGGIMPVTPPLETSLNPLLSDWPVPDGWLLTNYSYYWSMQMSDSYGNWLPWSTPTLFTIGESGIRSEAWMHYGDLF